jgi:hypothetical protein
MCAAALLVGTLTSCSVSPPRNVGTATTPGVTDAIPLTLIQLTLPPMPSPPAPAKVAWSAHYPQVSGAGLELRAVNVALRTPIETDEHRWAQTWKHLSGSGHCGVRVHCLPGERSSYGSKLYVGAASSVVVSLLTLVGGAYPAGTYSQYWIPTTVEVPSGTAVTLGTLFDHERSALAVLAAHASAALKQVACVEQVWTLPPNISSVWKSGASPTEDNYRRFALTPTGLEIGFDQGQVADEACGAHKVLVSWAAVRPFLSALGARLAKAAVRPH